MAIIWLEVLAKVAVEDVVAYPVIEDLSVEAMVVAGELMDMAATGVDMGRARWTSRQ